MCKTTSGCCKDYRGELCWYFFIDQHVREIQFLKKELELKLEEIIMEINPLVTLQSRVMKARDACKEPLRVNDLCLEER